MILCLPKLFALLWQPLDFNVSCFVQLSGLFFDGDAGRLIKKKIAAAFSFDLDPP